MSFIWGSLRWLVVITIVCWAIFIISMVIDRRRYQNAIYFSAGVLSLLITIGSVGGKVLSSICLILLFVILATVPRILMAGGLSKEQRGTKKTAGNYLAIVIGAILLIVEVIALIFFLTVKVGFTVYSISYVVLFLGVTILYGSLLLLAFVLLSYILQKLPKRTDFDYIIVDGDHLLSDGSLSESQRKILNKTIDVYHADPTTPTIIASGGRMKGDVMAEGEVMKRYLVEHDIPAEQIETELLSSNDKENVEYSKQIIDKKGDGKYVALVTDAYSVYRNASYGKDLGMDIVGIGAAMSKQNQSVRILSEFLSVFSQKPKRIALAVAGWALSAVLLLLVVL